MGRFTRAELAAAFHHYSAVVDGCATSGDWGPFADLFTEDVHYIEHAYGEFHSREDVRTWIVGVMAPFPHMRFPHEWVAYDEENGAILIGIKNLLDHPTEPGAEFWFPNWTRLVYAGDGLFSSEEDVYNPHRDAGRVIGEWMSAGGQMLTKPMVDMRFY
ncbi:nuclear transport factor 2 family protein [Nocardioides speluncae]|uniref:nuclear transport factor 2 family protein n=1 Tax=Nocardioides speluncae TaxID=2670337 RepID=UPI000D687D11|nr:nuclear transport factor 2 family protein [Nocardioides speluncae]